MRNEQNYTNYHLLLSKDLVFWNLFTSTHQKGKPQAHTPSFPFGMVRNARVNHLLCKRVLAPASLLT